MGNLTKVQNKVLNGKETGLTHVRATRILSGHEKSPENILATVRHDGPALRFSRGKQAWHYARDGSCFPELDGRVQVRVRYLIFQLFYKK